MGSINKREWTENLDQAEFFLQLKIVLKVLAYFWLVKAIKPQILWLEYKQLPNSFIPRLSILWELLLLGVG